MKGQEPAFPWEDQDDCGHPTHRFNGLTKREYFTALAMNGGLSAMNQGTITLEQVDILAKGWILVADRVLAELEKKP